VTMLRELCGSAPHRHFDGAGKVIHFVTFFAPRATHAVI